MKRTLITVTTVGICSGLGLTGSALAAPIDPTVLTSASGHGTQNDNARQFSFNAKRDADGTVTGQAQLVNKNFGGEPDSPAPFRAHIEISCMNTFGNTVVLGGLVRKTNDPNLEDAAYFTVQDNGEPGETDQISGVYFFDGDPATTGEPGLCLLTDEDALTLNPIEHGNIQVRPLG